VLAEYRLDELASLSNVSSRNIRAYRERGLLDPPRRKGRSAYYDDHHLGQLKIITDLLRKGFSSVHIAEFFTSIRNGHDLADLLGLQEAIFGRRHEEPAGVVAIDPECDEARRLRACGLAEVVDGELRFLNSKMAEIVGRAAEPLDYLRAILRVYDAAGEPIAKLAAAKARALQQSILARYGLNFMPKPEDMAQLRRVVADYRDLGDQVVADLLGAAVERSLETAVSDYAASVLNSDWERKAQ
jgi:DNA-binding transcriptional MerR regulator